MTEAELRALVRDTIAKHLGASGTSPAGGGAPHAIVPGGRAAAAVSGAVLGGGHTSHASHVLFALPAGDGACLIEPAVACNHCGYCKSYGH